jgi:hypothetical protein
MMGADKEFVLAHWGEGLDADYTDDHQFFFIADIGVNFDSWSSAAEFTRNRLEEIRQVEEEIRLLEGYNKSNKSCSENSFAELRSREQHATSFITVRRTIVRLHAALAELKKGMK